MNDSWLVDLFTDMAGWRGAVIPITIPTISRPHLQIKIRNPFDDGGDLFCCLRVGDGFWGDFDGEIVATDVLFLIVAAVGEGDEVVVVWEGLEEMAGEVCF